ncbi:hypothetical protein MNV49_000667 [Pseudohyphozyma bogoriensis]|nr:hypothetical protein MNV49_000667 [Pseudohyphozyma bogoriensis]
MAKGLFTVFSDETATVPARASSSSSSSKASQTRRKPLAADSSSSNSNGDGQWTGKENFDSFAKTDLKALGAGKLGKGKAAMGAGKAMRAKSVAQQPVADVSCGPVEKKLVKPKLVVVQKDVRNPATDDICTGTLRTRVLPDLAFSLPPLPELPPPAARARRHQHLRSDSPALSGSVEGSPSSAVDSGYAKSENGDDDDDIRSDEEATELVMESDDALNRRARALTESPLADVTQAYTGTGDFSLPNAASASPTPTTTNNNITRPRLRSSPSHSPSKSKSSKASLASELRSKPYPTTTTTTIKRTSRSTTQVEGLTKAVRTMRV